MRHNILINKLPETVEIDGQPVAINTSYKAAILLEQIMADNELSEYEKLFEAMLLYYGNVEGNIEQKLERIIWLYSCDNSEEGQISADADLRQGKRIFSFAEDADYIYAAFLAQYGIDLQVEDIHWWKFMALFKSLGEENEICKIMQIRAMPIDSDMSQKQKDHYNKLKRIYALPDNRTNEQKAQDFSRAFLAGMNL